MKVELFHKWTFIFGFRFKACVANVRSPRPSSTFFALAVTFAQLTRLETQYTQASCFPITNLHILQTDHYYTNPMFCFFIISIVLGHSLVCTVVKRIRNVYALWCKNYEAGLIKQLKRHFTCYLKYLIFFGFLMTIFKIEDNASAKCWGANTMYFWRCANYWQISQPQNQEGPRKGITRTEMDH